MDTITDMGRDNIDQNDSASLAIYVSKHCATCAYAYEVAESINHLFPKVEVRLVDIHDTDEVIPDVIFATPTYLLNGRVWSLGNPSPEKIREAFTMRPLLTREAFTMRPLSIKDTYIY